MRQAVIAFTLGALMCISCGKSSDRLTTAIGAKRQILLDKCARVGLAELPRQIYLRAFKEERVLEVWGYKPEAKSYGLIDTYPIAAMSGKVGPKRKEGDRQVPEGLYVIDVFNPTSQFLLSMRVNYPNASDRVFSDPIKPGTDIYIHGNELSIGCLAMTDDKIQEIYVLAHYAKGNRIPVHIFPARMTKDNLKRLVKAHPEHAALWKQIEPAYRLFETNKRIPSHKITKEGAYVVTT